ncbi:CD109 antigen-like [Limulus polyphemus]|uniref:CD109 antigen-like n=1 Tax=Limulus polyphemus TaxID=6850 RepID=A0ABM1C5H5_LIMPO|nr:CD109 antigen-like [Limulus polyphemus]
MCRASARKRITRLLTLIVAWIILYGNIHVVAILKDKETVFIPWDNTNDVIVDDDTFLYQTFGDSGQFLTEPRYIALASKYVRPGQIYRVAVTILSSPLPLVVRASLHRDNEELAADSTKMTSGFTNMLMMEVPFRAEPGRYTLRVEGKVKEALGGTGFINETEVEYSQRFLTILIQTNKLVYNLRQQIYIRVILLTTQLKPYTDPVDIYLVDSQGIVMKRWVSIYPYSGFVSVHFHLPGDYSKGWWKVRVVALEQVEEKKIKMERYFSHKMDVVVYIPAYVLTSEEYLEGLVASNHTSLAPVIGNATIRAVIKAPDHYKLPPIWDPYLLKTVALYKGSYNFQFALDDLRQLVAPHPLEGCEVEVQVEVGDRFLDIVLPAYSRTRIIKAELYLRFLGVSPQIFKPGMSFKTHLAISYDDLVPLSEDKLAESIVQVRPTVELANGGRMELELIEESFEEEGLMTIGFDTPKDATKITLHARYEDPDDEITTELVLLAYYSPKNRYMQITTSTAESSAGEYAIFHVWANFYMKTFHYLVVSKGIIILDGVAKVNGMINSITTFSVAISPEMAPACNVIVYHVTTDGHVITDSVMLPVAAINRADFSMEINTKQDRSGNLIELVPVLTIESIIGFSAFDSDWTASQGREELTPTRAIEAMYKFEESRLRLQRAEWRDREGDPENIQYYSTSNYGRDSNQTFAFSSLIVFTNMIVSSMPISRLEFLFNVTSHHFDYIRPQLLPNLNPSPGNAASGLGSVAEIISQWWLYDGDCFHLKDEDEELLDFHIYRISRNSFFFDATGGDFAWHDVITGNAEDEFVGCEVPKGPGLWRINAVGVSKESGLAILNEFVYYDATKPFFITVEAPTTAVIGEQIGMRVVVFNYAEFEIKAEVILEESDDYRFVQVEPLGVVSSYDPRITGGQHQHLLYIKPYLYEVVYVPIVATRKGDIEVTITGKTQVAKDEVITPITILADGVPVYRHTSLLLDLRNQAYNIKFLDINITEDPIIPFEQMYRRYIFGSPRAKVSIIGDIVGAPLPEDHFVNTLDMKFALPVKSGEHIMFNFAYNLYTLVYLRLTNQLVGSDARNILEFLNRVYVHQMLFWMDGAFTMFKKEPSVWLTAYCARIYNLAQYPDWENYLFIDPKVISDSIKFVLKYQRSDGSFYETVQHSWNRKMDPQMQQVENGLLRNATLTAHVTITLAEVSSLPGGLRTEAANARARAVLYLERQLPQLDSPYDVAIVTYALMVAGSVEAEVGFNMLDKMKRETEGLVYWSPEPIPPPEIVYQNQRPFIMPRFPSKWDSVAVEATAYALMVYVRHGGIIQDQIVRWLNTMRRYDAGFISTQDTIVAMQALIEASFRTHVRDITKMTLQVESSSNPGETGELKVDQDNLAASKSVLVAPNVWGHVEIQAKGSGLAVLQLDIQYNVDRDFLLLQPPLESFDLSVAAHYHGRNKSHLNIESCARWKLLSESPTSGVAVIEITLPTGYMIYKPIMDSYVRKEVVPRLRRGRVIPRSAVFMFEYLDFDWLCVNFTVERWYPVANLTRYLKARVYDYYTPERFKEVIYEAYDLYVLNICEVCGSYQCPYCPFFSGVAKLSSHMLSLLLGVIIWRMTSQWLLRPLTVQQHVMY